MAIKAHILYQASFAPNDPLCFPGVFADDIRRFSLGFNGDLSIHQLGFDLVPQHDVQWVGDFVGIHANQTGSDACC